MDRSNPRRFPIGKLPVKILERLFKQNRTKDRSVIVGPGIGENAAVIDIAATVIGEITDKNQGVKIRTADRLENLPRYEQDELTKIQLGTFDRNFSYDGVTQT
jgi:hydrogenase maturation factor